MSAHAIQRVGTALIVIGFLIFAVAPAQPSHDSAKTTIPGQHIAVAARSAEPSPEMIAGLIDWIVGKTGWTSHEPPPIEILPRKQLVKMFSEDPGGADGIRIVAVYSDDRHVVYLSKQWKSGSLHDRAVLLHEIVHHLQALNKIKATCRLEYEKQAYELSLAWLRDHGVKDPYALLGIDERFIYLMSHCPEF